MSVISAKSDQRKELQLKLISMFAILRFGREDQMAVITQTLFEIKDITKMDVDELRKVLYELTGDEQ